MYSVRNERTAGATDNAVCATRGLSGPPSQRGTKPSRADHTKKFDQGFALDPRGKEVSIKDLTFWPTGSQV